MVLFFVFGISMYLTAVQVVEIVERYDDECRNKLGETCSIIIDVEEDMKEPVYIYYEMVNFY
jgi:hypothetical protein